MSSLGGSSVGLASTSQARQESSASSNCKRERNQMSNLYTVLPSPSSLTNCRIVVGVRYPVLNVGRINSLRFESIACSLTARRVAKSN